MNDYIKDFGDEQEKKKLPVTFNPQDDWDFKAPIKPENKGKVRDINPSLANSDNDERSFAAENIEDQTITHEELKEMVANAVLNMMNTPMPIDGSLLESQKQEIEKIISEYRNRPGIMSIRFHENIEKDETSFGMLIDPTNTQNWVFLKEETVYKLPYIYKDSLYSFATEVWKKMVIKSNS